MYRDRVKSLLFAGACMCILNVASAQAQQFEFVFVHHEDELETKANADKLYSRLQEEAASSCAKAGLDEASSKCAITTVQRVVAGIDNKKLIGAHERANGAFLDTEDKTHFFFAMEDEAFDSFYDTKKLYIRLQEEVQAYCGASDSDADTDECAETLIERTVVAIDDSGLNHRHSKETRKGAVYIIDR